MENSNLVVVRKIKEFRNLKDITFEFIKGGITIIIGENNVGKTNLLDYIYERNREWDNFEGEYKEIRIGKEEKKAYRKDTSSLDMFFSEF